MRVANSVRAQRGAFKRQLGADRSRAAMVADLLLDPSSAFDSMLVWQLVLWAPMVGDQKAARMLKACGVDPWQKVGRLSVERREALAMMLRAHANGKDWVVLGSVPLLEGAPGVEAEIAAYLEARVLAVLSRGPLSIARVAVLIDAPVDGVRGVCERLARSGDVSRIGSRYVA